MLLASPAPGKGVVVRQRGYLEKPALNGITESPSHGMI